MGHFVTPHKPKPFGRLGARASFFASARGGSGAASLLSSLGRRRGRARPLSRGGGAFPGAGAGSFKEDIAGGFSSVTQMWQIFQQLHQKDHHRHGYTTVHAAF